MANLITDKQKKVFKNDYFIRLLVTVFLLASLLGIFLLAYLIPYYISVSKKELIVIKGFEPAIEAENKENVGESGLRIVNRTKEQLKVVELYNKSLIPSEYLLKIIENKNSNIRITKLSSNLVNNGQLQFIVGGISKNREGLVAFIEDLKFKAGFTTVESPVSDFAKDSDIDFILNIKMIL